MNDALLLHLADGATPGTTPGTTPSTAFQRASFGATDPFARWRDIAWQGPPSTSAGRIDFSGEFAVAAYPHTETLVVVEGQLALTEPGAAPLVLGRGEGVVITRGTALRVQAVEPTRLVFCAASAKGLNPPGLVRLRADADFKPSNPPPAEVLLGPVPQCRSDNVFTDEGADYRAGTWDSTAYHRIVRPHRVHELMVLLEGHVRFERPDGSAVSARAGDAVFVPQGAPIGWESTGHVAKFYVVQEAKA